MVVVVLTGKDKKYLGVRKFNTLEKAHSFVEAHEPLALANIEGELPLKERIAALCPLYFVYAGAIWDFEIIDFTS